jgi:hypothetical protein
MQEEQRGCNQTVRLGVRGGLGGKLSFMISRLFGSACPEATEIESPTLPNQLHEHLA